MFVKNYIINGEIICKTGLHIGGSVETIEIGGSDNPVLRDPISNLPFIPGSSIKGKLRLLLELSDKESSKSIIENRGRPSESGIAAEFFGVANKEEGSNFSNKIIVRDSYPTEETIKMWNESPEVIDGAELKYENTLNRITSEAKPRNIERVPINSKFKFEIILSIANNEYENISNYESLKPLFKPMKLLEDDYLGGSGTRGFGKIEFDNITIKERNLEYYTENTDENVIVSDSSLDDAIAKLKKN